MDTILYYPILLPLVFGAVSLLFPRKIRGVREVLAILASLTMIGLSTYLFTLPDITNHSAWVTLRPGLDIPFDLATSPFQRMALLVVSVFSLMTSLYSFRFMETHPRRVEYYAYYLAALGATFGAVLADNLIVFLLFWELHGFLLFLMAGLNGDEAIRPAAKTLVMAGVGDVTLMTGIGLLWLSTGTLSFSQLALAPQALTNGLSITAFLMILIGASVKGGIMPFHSWIPAISTHTPMTVMSYFTSLDKVLGIYLLTRISLSLFVMDGIASLLIMTLGAITLLGGVLMAMVQHDYRRMLAFHSVSQVGYMVLGIGTGTAIGIIGGLFHLINMIILKGSLYLCGGSVQRQTGRTRFEELGGLAKAMPWTFAGTLVAALGIAGVPPLNAFVSKWLIYQGIIEKGGGAFPIFLAAAMFGSALTLASFVKLLYSMFWGVRAKGLEDVKESPATMTIPLIVLAAFALGFGIFYRVPVNALLSPILATTPVVIPGLWDASLATVLMIASLLLGVVIWLVNRPRETVTQDIFIGGEKVDAETFRVRGTEFYGPVKEFTFLKNILTPAQQGTLDIYNIGMKFLRWFSKLVYKYIDQSLAEFYEEIIPSVLTLVGRLLRLLNARLVMTHLLWLIYVGSAIALAVSPGNQAVATTVRIIAIVGMIGWAFLAWVETDLLRLLVLAATSQVGLILLGGSMSLALALSYLSTSGVALLFLAFDGYLIRRQWKTTTIEKMNGLATRSPFQFLIFVFSALWLSGLPPFGNFFSKYLLGVAAEGISPILSVAITATAILTLAYLLKPISHFLRTT
jgi:formate hydrogenlyase subunit 3/multisubunit Na+/H+ antiporter MnhD subunit